MSKAEIIKAIDSLTYTVDMLVKHNFHNEAKEVNLKLMNLINLL